MDKIITFEMSKNEAEQLSALMEISLAAMQQAQRQMADDQEEIERLKLSTRRKLAEIRRCLNVETSN